MNALQILILVLILGVFFMAFLEWAQWYIAHKVSQGIQAAMIAETFEKKKKNDGTWADVEQRPSPNVLSAYVINGKPIPLPPIDTDPESAERDADQAYFWTPEWQKKEREADKQIASGDYKEFSTPEQMILDMMDEDDCEDTK